MKGKDGLAATNGVRPIVVLDACVLYGATVRNLVLELGVAGLIWPRWTESIHAEWMRGLSGRRPDIPPAKLQALRRAIDAAIPDCLVDGYQRRVADLALPDPDDRHVLAAAIACGASAIVTFNLRDFPGRVISAHGIRAISPDQLVMELIELSPHEVCAGVRRMRTRLRQPPYTRSAILDLLLRCGLLKTAERLQEHLAEI